MRKKTALKIFNRQIEKLSGDFYSDYSWTSPTKEYIARIFGNKSNLFEAMNVESNSLHVYITQGMVQQSGLNDYKKRFVRILDACIEHVSISGVPRTGNFLSKLSDDWLIAIITVLVPGLFLGGMAIGKYLSDTQNIELHQRIKELEKALLSPSSAMPQEADTISHNKGDSNRSAN